jgi:hypothetical protein
VSIVTTPRAGRREWVGLAVIALPCIAVLVATLLRHVGAAPQPNRQPNPNGPCAGKVGAVKAPGHTATEGGQ